MTPIGPDWYWLKFRVLLHEPPKLHPPVEKMGEILGYAWMCEELPVWENRDIEVDVVARTVTLPGGTFTLESFLAAAHHIKQRVEEVQTKRGEKFKRGEKL